MVMGVNPANGGYVRMLVVADDVPVVVAHIRGVKFAARSSAREVAIKSEGAMALRDRSCRAVVCALIADEPRKTSLVDSKSLSTITCAGR